MVRITSVFFILIGIALLGVALVTTLSARHLVNEGLTATGQVAKLNAGGSHPEIAFTTARGEHIRYPQGGLIGGYKVGDAVRVFYHDANPISSATVGDIGALYFWPLLLGLLGGGFALLGVFQYLANRSI